MPDFDYSDPDHQRLSDLIDQIIDTTNNSLRMALFDQLRTEFARHEQRVASAAGHQTGHTHLRELIDTIDQTSISSDLWIEKIGELRNALYMHRQGREAPPA